LGAYEDAEVRADSDFYVSAGPPWQDALVDQRLISDEDRIL
jgi:hypothetical protein